MPVAVTALVLLVALTAYLVLRGGEPDAARPGPAPTTAAGPGDAGPEGRTATTAALLLDLERALRGGDVSAARALAASGAPGARRLAAALVRNVERLGVTGLEVTAVAEAPAAADLEGRFGPGSRVAAVRVAWRYAGTDQRALVSAVELLIAPEGTRAALAGTRPAPGERTPLWLLEDLTVRRQGRVLVAGEHPATAARLLRQATRAVQVVARRVPGWRGELVVEAPATAQAFRATSGASAAAARSIAAATTTADGSTMPGSPARVYVNPRVFAPLGPAGQQIVLSHEVAHVAVGDPSTSVPLWLSEGFADWVALADSRVPVRVLASQVRALVADEGAPSRFPGRGQLAAGNPDVGAAYESAWLAVRLIATTYGEADLLRFRGAVESRGVDRAFRTVLETSTAAFTRSWRRELTRLAG